ncbi:transposase [Streptomyces sp. NPDC096132]|uniref:transposase n=1 Tax=Streptomyces sp. NPDC096132 TaxID=3366075 RepID=UPI0037F37E33
MGGHRAVAAARGPGSWAVAGSPSGTEGIVFKVRTGLPWRGPSERFGPWQTVRGRFARWAADGTFDRILSSVQSRAEVNWLVAVDSTIVRVHQHAAAKGGSRNQQNPPRLRRTGPAPGLLGHRRHHNDCTQVEDVISRIRVPPPA